MLSTAQRENASSMRSSSSQTPRCGVTLYGLGRCISTCDVILGQLWMILNSPVPVVVPENGAVLTSIQEQVPNQSKSEKLINKGCTSLHLPSPKYGNQPLPRGPSNHLSHFYPTSSCREPCDVPELVQNLQVHSLQATKVGLSQSHHFFNMSDVLISLPLYGFLLFSLFVVFLLQE